MILKTQREHNSSSEHNSFTLSRNRFLFNSSNPKLFAEKSEKPISFPTPTLFEGITREKFESSASSRLSFDRFFVLPSPRQKWWPGSAWFSGYYAFTVAQRHQVMDESRGEARIICFEANPKTSARFFPMIYEHILQQRPMCRLLIQPLLPRLIYSRLISPADENSNRWNRLRPTGEELQLPSPVRGWSKPDILRTRKIHANRKRDGFLSVEISIDSLGSDECSLFFFFFFFLFVWEKNHWKTNVALVDETLQFYILFYFRFVSISIFD